jgi:hypothetical protein
MRMKDHGTTVGRQGSSVGRSDRRKCLNGIDGFIMANQGEEKPTAVGMWRVVSCIGVY